MNNSLSGPPYIYKDKALKRFIKDIFNGKITKNTVLPDLYTNDYSWVNDLTPSMLRNTTVKKALKILAHNKAKQILRRMVHKESNKDLLEWLELSTELGSGVRMSIVGNSTTYTYDNMRVTITDNINNSKYSGLDMFSSTGQPLTTRDQIKARRLELLPKHRHL